MSHVDRVEDPPRPAGRGRPAVAKVEIFALFGAFASLVAVHAPLIAYKAFANVDEAYAAALAERLLEGYKLYQGAISQRGPLMYYLFEAFAWLHGWDNIVALRVWALVLALLHLFLVYWAGRRLLSPRAATIAACVVGYGLAFGFPPEDAMAINGEPLQMPALLVAIVLGFEAVRAPPGSRARVARLLVTGLLFGVAISIKQSVALHPAVVVLYMIVDAVRRKVPRKRLALEIAALTAATLLVPALLLAHSAAEGTLSNLIYYCYTYNKNVHLNPTKKHFVWLGTFFFRLGWQTSFLLLSALLAALGVPWLTRRVRAAKRLKSLRALGRGFGVAHYLAFHFVFAVFAASAMYRFFPHYYLQALPFMALLTGAVVDPWMRRRRTALAGRAVVVAMTLVTMLCAGLGCYFGEKVDGRVSHDRTIQDLGKLIAATTKPDDKIFVWGFSPWIYEYSHRRPAGRYVFETYATGFVPWYWEKLDVEKGRIVPGSVEGLLDDLDHENPAVVVDSGSVMMGRSMRTYEKPNAWLHAHYCFDMRLGAHDVYRRKPADGKCRVPFFPRAHGTIDFRAGAMDVPIPRTLDWDESRPLPEGNFWKAIYFPEFGKPEGLEALRDPRREKDEKEAAAEGFYIPELGDPGYTPSVPVPQAPGPHEHTPNAP